MKKLSKIRAVIFGIFLLITLFFEISCTSTKPVPEEKQMDLKVIILDETNTPVPDFQVFYTMKKGGQKSKALFTNEEGFCSFERTGEGKYFLNGSKPNFAKMENIEVRLEKATDVFFCTVSSKNIIFEKAAKLYKKQRYEEGLSLLGELQVDKNSPVKAGILFYEYYGFSKLGKSNESNQKLKELKRIKFPEIYNMCSSIKAVKDLEGGITDEVK